MAFKPIVKDYSHIAKAGQIASNAIVGVGASLEKKHANEANQAKIAEAEEIAKKDWKEMENAVKALKTTYKKKAIPLIEKGVYTQEQLDSDMEMLPSAYSQDKKDIRGFMVNFGNNLSTLSAKLDKLAGTTNTGEAVQKAAGAQAPEVGIMPGQPAPKDEMAPGQAPGQIGSPGGADTIQKPQLMSGRAFQEAPGQPAAETKEQVARRLAESNPEITTKMAEENPLYDALPSEVELAKSNKADDRQKYLEAKELRMKSQQKFKESQDSWKEALGWAKFYLKKDVELPKKHAKELTAAQTKLTQMIGVQKNRLSDLKKDLNEAKNPQPEYEGMPAPEVNQAVVDILAAQVEEMNEQIQNMANEKKMAITLPKETRKFGPKGETTTTFGGDAIYKPKTVAPPPQAAPAPTPSIQGGASKSTEVSIMEKSIRDSLNKRGVAQEVIEQYIQRKKQAGAL